MKEITQRGDIILFIDELHNLVGAGAAEGAIDAASILKPALARGELQTIGATTLDEYRKYLERDAALERRFQQIRVEEPTIDETVQILRGLRDRYEAHHRVQDHRRGAARRRRARRPLHPGPPPARQGDRPDRRGRLAHAHHDDDRAAALPRARGGDRDRSARTRRRRSRRRSSRRPPSLRDKERKLSQKKKELEERLAQRGRRGAAGDRRGRDRRHRLDVDGHPGLQAHRGRVAEARPHGGRAPQARHRPGGGDRRRLEGDPPRARRASRTRSARPARSSSSARRASGRPSSRGRSPSSCSATRTR